MGEIFKFSVESDIAVTNRERKAIYDNKKTKLSTSSKNDVKITFHENLEYSIGKGILVLFYYCINHNDALLLLLLFAVALTIYFRVLKAKYVAAKLYNDIQYPKQIFNYPLLSAIVIVFTISQFLLPLPPLLFSEIIWGISALALTIILRKSITTYWFRVWGVVLLFAIIAMLDNILLRYSKSEENFILFMNVCGILIGLFLIFNRKKPNRHFVEKTIFISVIVLIVFETLSLIFLFSGNYNKSKTFMTNGFFTILIAYLMVWTYYLINDVKTLSYYLKETDEEREKLVLDTNKKTDTIIYLLIFVGWVFLISRNTYFFQSLSEPLNKILFQPKTFGEFTFTYSSIIVFFVVLFISGFISRLVSFLATETRTLEKSNRKSGVGSWLLLVRIGIISLGIVIAFASAGIPMDRLALILSALGVGIGFGLQTLVNNIVSGLIIAFEKPVNLDDVIEVGGQSGKMKSIGIRSSVVTTWQGSDVIIPNGDLLSNNLINWTLGSSKRRIDFSLGVAYGSDIEKVIAVLKSVLDNNKRVLKNPEYIIQVDNFNDSSIDFVIKFWVQHFEMGLDVKSDVLIAIDQKFKENKIEIPFPQQDIHIKTAPKEKIKK
jgi:potassium efflux system protein